MAVLIVVEEFAGGAVVGRGGQAARVLQALRGLEQLGHDVVFLEFLESDPGPDRERAIEYFAETAERWWHPDRSALVCEVPLESIWGMSLAEIARAAEQASALLSMMATYHPQPYPLVGDIRPRIVFDQDPAYTQIWAQDGSPSEIYGEQDVYYTVGMNIGTGRCAVPTLGIDWRRLWNPVLLDWWPGPGAVARNRFTTVADWRGYGYLEFEGRILGPKAEEFRRFIDLPALAGETPELTLSIDADDPDIVNYTNHGWRIEQAEMVRDAGLFRDYVAGSLAEFSCAKGGYVGTRCGWFSDRSAYYLACGRPVVVQSTGFEDLLPVGKGLFAVKTVGEAADAMEQIRRDYSLHSAAALDIAREFFDARKILPQLLRDISA